MTYDRQQQSNQLIRDKVRSAAMERKSLLEHFDPNNKYYYSPNFFYLCSTLGLKYVPDKVLLKFMRDHNYLFKHNDNDNNFKKDLNLILTFLQGLEPTISPESVISILRDPELKNIKSIDIRYNCVTYSNSGYHKPYDKLSLKEVQQADYVRARWFALCYQHFNFTNVPQEIDQESIIKRLLKVINPNTDIKLMLIYISIIRRKSYVSFEDLNFKLISDIINLRRMDYSIHMLLLFDNDSSLSNFKPKLNPHLIILHHLTIWNNSATIPISAGGVMNIFDVYYKVTKFNFDWRDTYNTDKIVGHIPVYELSNDTYILALKAYFKIYNSKQPTNKQISNYFISYMLELRIYKLIQIGKSELINKENHNDEDDWHYIYDNLADLCYDFSLQPYTYTIYLDYIS